MNIFLNKNKTNANNCFKIFITNLLIVTLNPRYIWHHNYQLWHGHKLKFLSFGGGGGQKGYFVTVKNHFYDMEYQRKYSKFSTYINLYSNSKSTRFSSFINQVYSGWIITE